MIKTQYSHAMVFVASMYLVAAATFVAGALNPVRAAGMTPELSSTSFATGTTANELTFSVPSTSAEYQLGDTFSITAETGLTIEDCTTSTEDADGDGETDGSPEVTGQTYTYTFSSVTTAAESEGVDFCVGVSSDTVGNYSLSFTDNKAEDVSTNDYGAALVYIGDANDVVVTAQVQPSLAFVIRDSSDTADTNICELGVLNLASVNECSYRLKVSTNSDSGYTVSVATDGALSKSGAGDLPDAENIDTVADLSTVTAGAEGYGIALDAGTATSSNEVIGSSAAGFTYESDDTPLPLVADGTKLLYTSLGQNNPGATDTTNTALVTHRASMDADTNTGNYQHIVTYTVLASF